MSDQPPSVAAASSQPESTKPRRRRRRGRKTSTPSGRPKIFVEPIAGTRDYLPEDMRNRNWLFSLWRETARVFGFDEYDAPILERTELFVRKSGNQICEQMYCFEDKSGLEVSLRPEMTPSLARLVMKAGKSLLLPIKWYSIPQCWRWETATRGRRREFFQWNMDILGVREVSADAEIIATIVWFCELAGLASSDVVVRISSRKLLDSYVKSLDVPDGCFMTVCRCVDKFESVGRGKVIELLLRAGISEDDAGKIVAFVEAVSLDDIEALAQGSEEMLAAIAEMKHLFDLLEGYGIEDWVAFDPSIVRGLAYFTGTCFEVFAKRGSLVRVVAAGGRYDTLLQGFGEQRPVPAVGFGLGDTVVFEVLRERGLLPSGSKRVDDVVIPYNVSFTRNAVDIATRLRRKGRVVDIVLRKCRARQAFSYADRVGAERAIYVAPREWVNGQVKVKMLRETDAERKDALLNLDDL